MFDKNKFKGDIISSLTTSLIRAARSLCAARPSVSSEISRSMSSGSRPVSYLLRPRIVYEVPRTIHPSTPTSSLPSSFFDIVWKPEHRLPTIASIFTVVAGAGLFVDAIYRRASKTELDQGLAGLRTEMKTIETKIDNLTTALLSNLQRDKIATEVENRELKAKNEQLIKEKRTWF